VHAATPKLNPEYPGGEIPETKKQTASSNQWLKNSQTKKPS